MTMLREYIVLLADIHANEKALRQVMGDARQRYGTYGELRIWFLGDLFGRGPDPVTIWRRFMGYKPEICIAGNHDWGVIGRARNVQTPVKMDGFFKEDEWWVILYHRDRLVKVGLLGVNGTEEPCDGEVFQCLANWPVVCSPYLGIYLVHGGWASILKPQRERSLDYLIWDYVKRPEDAQHTLDALQWSAEHASEMPESFVFSAPPEAPRVVIVGHYHRRTLYCGHLGEPKWENPVRLNYTYELAPQPQVPILISPGSVGFPREDHDLDGSYAVLHLEDQKVRSVTFHKVQFDRPCVIAQMKSKHYPRDIIGYLQLPGETAD